MNDIICAISTPPGMGAIAVIRLSGKGSIAVADTLFVSPSGKRLADAKANSVLFGEIRFNNEVTDEVLVTVFHAPVRSRVRRVWRFRAMVRYISSRRSLRH